MIHSLSSFSCNLLTSAFFGIVETNIRLYVRLLCGEHEKFCASRHWFVCSSLCVSFKNPRNLPQTGHAGSSCVLLLDVCVLLFGCRWRIGWSDDPCSPCKLFVSVTWLELVDISVVVTCSDDDLTSIFGITADELLSLESRLFPAESFKIEPLPSLNACLIMSNSSVHSVHVLCGTCGLSRNIWDGGETT